MKPLGAVACGNPVTAQAAELMLQEGGNAFDAIVAAHFAACVAEPVLASPAGGGFLLAEPVARDATLYDFFTHTPQLRRPVSELDFYPITADFGSAQQEFHIGLGAVATPGAIQGLFQAHRELGRLPMTRVMEPAVAAARHGVVVDAMQSYIFDVVQPIYQVSTEVRQRFASQQQADKLLRAGEVLCQRELADTLEALAREGEQLFYLGEIGKRCVEQMRHGGCLTAKDLADYRSIRRKPLALQYRGTRVYTNPPPSSGGLLIVFALQLLQTMDLGGLDRNGPEFYDRLIEVMRLTDDARLERLVNRQRAATDLHMLEQDYLDRYRTQILGHPRFRRGTTHMSTMDAEGNIASLTVSNGEGCGHCIPGTGIMLNNMLGEEDVNPEGFHRWQPNMRMASMMAPSILHSPDGSSIALGSGGSNRIRSAILQVIINLIDHSLPLEAAIDKARVHFEDGLLNLEPGLDVNTLNELLELYPRCEQWQERNLFFGGVHAVRQHGNEFAGTGDARRGGVARVVVR